MNILDKYSDSLTVAQVAESQTVSAKTVRKWCSMDLNPLPSYKIGNVIRIRKEALLKWISEREAEQKGDLICSN